MSAALAGVIGHSHEPPGQINDESTASARQEGSVDDATGAGSRRGSAAGTRPVRADRRAPGAIGHPVARSRAAAVRAVPDRAPGPQPVSERSRRSYGNGGTGNRRRSPGSAAGWGGRILILLAVLALLSVIAMAQFLIKPAIKAPATAPTTSHPQ